MNERGVGGWGGRQTARDTQKDKERERGGGEVGEGGGLFNLH